MMAIFRRKEIEGLNKAVTDQKAEIARLENVVKSISLSNPRIMDILKGTGQLKGAKDSLTSPYQQITAVHSCVKWKARNFAQVPFRLYSGDNEITKGPMYDLFQAINPTLDPYQFWEGISTSLDINGNAYIIIDETAARGVPSYLWLFNPAWTRPAYDSRTKAFIGWEFARGGNWNKKEFIPPERVIQVKYYNPYDEILGLSPLGVLRLTNETLFGAAVYNKVFFENDATPATVYTQADRVPERKLGEIEKQLIEDSKGARRGHSTKLLTGGWDVKTLGLSQKDIQFLEMNKYGREDIAMVYGVPKKILGLYEDINMATAISAELQFWEDTVMPCARMIECAINAKMLAPVGLTGRFDFSAIDVLNQRVLEKVDALQKLLATGAFTRNELNAKFQLGFEDVAWGDEPITFAPIITESAAKAAPPIEFPKVEVEKIDMDKAILAEKWAKQMTPLVSIISRATKATRDYWHGVEQKIIKALTKKVDGVRYIKTPELDSVEEAVTGAIDDEGFYVILEPYLKESMAQGISTISRTTFMMDNAEALEILKNKYIAVKEMNDTAKREIVDDLREIISAGLSEGLGQDVIARNIIDGIGDRMDKIKTRAKTQARTEVNASFSQARVAAVEEDPPTHIKWISSRDSKVRDMHAYLDGKVVPYGETFANGLRYPHDPNGSADEVINCRCTWEPIWR